MDGALSVDLPPGLEPDEARTLLVGTLLDRGRLTLAAEGTGCTRPAFSRV